MAAITAAAEGAKEPATDRAHRALPKGTIGSVRAGLGGIQEIDTHLILPWGPRDRLEPELTAVNSTTLPDSLRELAESIAGAGQQVPVLLRPAEGRDGHFEAIYGQRRILACRHLGRPVRALIRTLDDTGALLAKGLENAGRAELSYYERVRFAEAILEQGHSRAEVCQALAISKHTLSQLERIGRLVPARVGEAIGAAPGAGRPKWTRLATAFDSGRLSEAAALAAIARAGEVDSDARLDQVLRTLRQDEGQEAAEDARSPLPGVRIRKGPAGLTMTVSATASQAGFADWLDRDLDGLLQAAHDRFLSESD